MNRFRDVFPSTPSEILAMSTCYALVALGFWMVLRPYEAGAAITRAAVAIVGALT